MSFEANYNEPKDRYFASENYTFQSAGSPVTLDVYTALNAHGVDGAILCETLSGGATGDILVEISTDGTVYHDQFRLFHGETFKLFGYRVNKIRITHTGTDSGYRVICR